MARRDEEADECPPRGGGDATAGDLGVEQVLTVRFAYPVLFTRGMFQTDNGVLADLLAPAASPRQARVLAVIDDGVHAATPELERRIATYFAAYAGRLELAAAPLVVPGGERAKSDPALISHVHERLFGLGFDRHGYLLAVGGGAMLDAVGYAAALFHRGLRLVRAPTTVLAQDDAGVGVKNGVNAYGVKNALGTFAPPSAVINDADFLSTLSLRDHVAGTAEALKVALIRDRPFFEWLEQRAPALRAREPAATSTLIRRCAALHLEHIRSAGDPFESGSARPLDFGHWAAHKLEILSHHELRHGEAVAIGMAIDTRYSALAGMISARTAERVEAVIAALGLPRSHPALQLEDADGTLAVLAGLEEFREHLGGELTITLLREIGRGVEVRAIDLTLMRDAIRALSPGES